MKNNFKKFNKMKNKIPMKLSIKTYLIIKKMI